MRSASWSFVSMSCKSNTRRLAIVLYSIKQTAWNNESCATWIRKAPPPPFERCPGGRSPSPFGVKNRISPSEKVKVLPPPKVPTCRVKGGGPMMPTEMSGSGGFEVSSMASVLRYATHNQRRLQTTTLKVLKALTWLVVLGSYVLYLVAQSNTKAAYVAHEAVARTLLRMDAIPNGTGTASTVSAVVTYLRRGIVSHAWRDPTCGDGVCEAPYEGTDTCPADCGVSGDEVHAVVRVASDFRHTHILSEDALRRAARWNLCRRDDERARAGMHGSLCYYDADQTFESGRNLKVADVMLSPGVWYLRVDGEPAGRTEGTVIDGDVLQSEGAAAASVAEQLDARGP